MSYLSYPMQCCANNQPTWVYPISPMRNKKRGGLGDRAGVQMDFINGSVVNKKVVKWAAK